MQKEKKIKNLLTQKISRGQKRLRGVNVGKGRRAVHFKGKVGQRLFQHLESFLTTPFFRAIGGYCGKVSRVRAQRFRESRWPRGPEGDTRRKCQGLTRGHNVVTFNSGSELRPLLVAKGIKQKTSRRAPKQVGRGSICMILEALESITLGKGIGDETPQKICKKRRSGVLFVRSSLSRGRGS